MIEQVVERLLFEHEETLNVLHDDPLHKRHMHEALHAELTRELRDLRADAWAVAQPDPGVYVLAGDHLHLVMLDPARNTASVDTRPIAGNTSAVQKRTRPDDDRRTDVDILHTWTFRYVGEQRNATDMLHRIEGAVSVDHVTVEERPDPREKIARSIAARGATPRDTN